MHSLTTRCDGRAIRAAGQPAASSAQRLCCHTPPLCTLPPPLAAGCQGGVQEAWAQGEWHAVMLVLAGLPILGQCCCALSHLPLKTHLTSFPLIPPAGRLGDARIPVQTRLHWACPHRRRPVHCGRGGAVGLPLHGCRCWQHAVVHTCVRHWCRLHPTRGHHHRPVSAAPQLPVRGRTACGRPGQLLRARAPPCMQPLADASSSAR